jgi:hypothetical protein
MVVGICVCFVCCFELRNFGGKIFPPVLGCVRPRNDCACYHTEAIQATRQILSQIKKSVVQSQILPTPPLPTPANTNTNNADKRYPS